MDKPVKKHSKAFPTSMADIPGGSIYGPPTWKKADWNHWEQMPHCKIRDIVALSLDLEPSNPKHEIRTWPPEYSNRLQITNAHIECGKLTRSKAVWHSIDMSTYGTWALSMGWSLPDRFPRSSLINAPTSITQAEIKTEKVKASPDWKDEARRLADDFFDKDTKINCRRTLQAYADLVMDEMQKLEIHAPRGRIDNAGTIKREALQGKKWWGFKVK